MSGLQGLASEKIWFDKHRYDEAEKHFHEKIQQALEQVPHGGDQGLISCIEPGSIETLHSVLGEMATTMQKPESTTARCDKSTGSAGVPPAVAALVQEAPAKQIKVENDDDDDDIDLFGSNDDHDEETKRIKQECLDAYSTKEAKKAPPISKSSIVLDVKPWDDKTDMIALEECVRSLQMDGLLWGASKLVAVGYGIRKLQINCVVKDDKVGTDILEEEITKFQDYVQSVDVAAFNKI